MSFELAKQCLEFAQSCGVSRIVLIGGEPTLHPKLLSIMDAIHNLGMRAALVTNGVRFGDPGFRSAILNRLSGEDVVNVSIKGSSSVEYAALCSAPKAFEMVVEGLRALKAAAFARVSVSYVVSRENIDYLEKTLQSIREMTNVSLGLSFCGPCFDGDSFDGRVSIEDRASLANECLEILGNVFIEGVSLHLNLPICKVDADALSKALGRCEVHTGCHALNNSGIVFDTNGDLLLCNHLLGVPVGRFGKDYSSSDEFLRFIGSQVCLDAWSAFTRLPYKDCRSCESLLMCGGGCPLQFF